MFPVSDTMAPAMLLHRLILLPVVASTLNAQTPLADKIQGGGIELVLVLPGKFTQGSPGNEPGREADEERRDVTITQAFYMSVTPVSLGAWKQFVQATNYRTEAEKGTSGGFGFVEGKLIQGKQYTWKNPGFPQTDEDPVVMVTWDDAQAFCRWFSKSLKRKCTLPTEAQWEYAARAGTAGLRYGEPLDEVAWHRGNSNGVTHPVGQNRANPWGLKDMYGPVWQWCEDWYAPYDGKSALDPLQRNPNLSDKPRRVLRGGSFISDPSHSRSAERYRNDPKSRNADNGFRIVSTVEIIAEAPTPAVAKPAAARPATSAPANTAPPEPQAVNSVNRSPGFSLFGWLPCAIPLMIVFFVIRGVSKRARSRQKAAPSMLRPVDPFGDGQRSSDSPVDELTTRIVDDGFWINGPTSAAGSTVSYHYVVKGVTQNDQVVFAPGPQGHFIFTGSRPQSVSIRTSGAVVADTPVSSHPAVVNDDDDDRRQRRSASSFPPAY